jgi:Tfp pilus assembly protein PilF
MSKRKNGHPRKKANALRKQKKPSGSNTGEISTLLSSALSLYEQGELGKARKIYLKVLKRRPDNTDVLYNLGTIASEQGRHDEALGYYEHVLSRDPAYVNAHFNLGGILLERKEYDAAYDKFHEVLTLSPDYATAWFSLGVIAGVRKQYDEARKCYQKALSIEPNLPAAWYNIGCLSLEREHDEEAAWHFQKAVSVDPGYTDAWLNLGFVAMNRSDYALAIEYYEKALALRPDSTLAYNNMGLSYQYQDRFDKALECYHKALSINPEDASAHLNLGNVFRAQGCNEKALEHYKKSLSIEESLVGLSNTSGLQKELCNYNEASELTSRMLAYGDLKKSELASIHDMFIQIGEWEKASETIKRFREAEINPQRKDVLAGSFMKFCATTDLSLDEIADIHKQWGRLTEERVQPYSHEGRVVSHNRSKKLRIGYSSPDLREHSVGYLIKDIIASHNRDKFEVYCYANFDQKNSDRFTQEIIDNCTMFKFVSHLSDREVAEEIYNDEIDILIELAGHTAGHRLRALAYKPAPFQITYLGYPNTTGMSRIDYRITDRFAESTLMLLPCQSAICANFGRLA